MKRWWTKRLAAFAILSLAIAGLPFAAHADITGGLQDGYSDNFNYPGVTPAHDVPLDATHWQTMPVASNGQSVAGVWTVGDVNTSGTGLDSVLSTSSNTKALKQNTNGFNAAEPIAFVRGGDWQNMIIQVTAAFLGSAANAGVGVVFKAPVDPISGLADKNNYYFFNGVNSPRLCIVTTSCFVLGKRVGGQFFLAAVTPTYLNLVPSNGQVFQHVYKVIMSGDHIMCFIDGQLLIDVHDTSGDDSDTLGGGFTLPGPMFADGTVGVRTSETKAWFNNFTVMGNSPKASEGRAAAMDTYGQAGSGANGVAIQQTGADTGFQYNDHDFSNTPSQSTIAPVSPTNGVTGGALVSTTGSNGLVTSTAQLLGFSGVLTQTMPDGSTVIVNLMSDSISAVATATCDATTAAVQLQNMSYVITVNNSSGVPLVQDGKVTQVNPPANTTIADPASTGGYVKITLNSQDRTTDPMRADVSAIRIDFLQQNLQAMSQGKTLADSGITYATVHIANVVAGRLCNSNF
ncbi:MAG: hypothetical protein ACYDCC_01945 [Actinomycetota bacterium]